MRDAFTDVLRLVAAQSVFSGGIAAGGDWSVNELGFPGVSVYAASKAALRSLARSFAAELMPRRIRVNAVSPGPTDTSILERTIGKEAAEPIKAGMREQNPMKRFGRPEEVARAAIFLAFEATFTTGAELVVDGGATQL